ncbi:hypothetical protein [Campylobacter hyointestinalis]|uniref:Uncharacterized protein n=1 Tax=Campylobacter hyointestinalis subsp. hyointestinalis TaxID=91352 RepID=A0A855N3H9_CAMHY|nr:hypothetical protein [Campylobacter hyointestinalis]PPB55950.1 hypothetical protein CDQ70_09135 [Campylobacter hyointestinalis subsp. hyointestinalis]PPB70051.1 hypothetical protein CDQ78_09255 [Campylobacter hyointestinalis subsp. hyointestinalis]RAZ46171.1 hypothetical protein CHL14416_06445 [Campylobacter hyointestinalis subsp. lawsonii]TWO22957.1 hypothetical protein YZ80_01575 [Campylobacter hyointestinalis]CUU74884.1 Uncharacterised protein [Campylobacter hyointestinalis subsp. hyoint
MVTLAITGEMTPQMIKVLKEQINKLSPMLQIETIKGVNIPTSETMQALNSKETFGVFKNFSDYEKMVNDEQK